MSLQKQSAVSKLLEKNYPSIILIFIISLVCSIFLFDFSFIESSNFTVFLSITIGYQITAVSVLYNSKILNALHENKDNIYITKLHRLAAYYKYSVISGVIFLFISIFINDFFTYEIQIYRYGSLKLRKSILFLPMFLTVVYFFTRANMVFFKLFTLPRNE